MTLSALIIFGTLILLILFPYVLNILKLENPKKIIIPSEGHHAQLSRGRIYYRWHEPKNLLSDDVIVLVHGFSTPSFVWNGVMQDLLSTGTVSYTHLTLPTNREV